MNDIATLKSLTNIRPIATLNNYPVSPARFNRIFFERESAFGLHENGIVLTISDNAHPDVLEWADFIKSPIGDVRIRRVVTEADLESLQLRRSGSRLRRNCNYAVMLSDGVAVFRFSTVRWFGQSYPIAELTKYFEHLRRAYLLCPTSGRINVPIMLGSVKHVYTSRAQMEEVLYPMAYYFFREDTEL